MTDKKLKSRRESASGGKGSNVELDAPLDVDTTVTHIPRVLIVEDMVELGEVSRVTIERMQILVFTETHGLTALERYNEIRPDIVMLDIALPDMTGWKVLDAIKESKAIFRSPKIIVMTAYGDPANRLMGKLQGVDKYLIKPFTPAEVVKLIREVLANKPDEPNDSNVAANFKE